MDNNLSWPKMVFGFLCLTAAVIFSGIVSFYSAYELYIGLTSHADSVTFNKGAMTMLGLCLMFSCLLLGYVWQGVLHKDVSKKAGLFVLRVMLAGLAIAFVLPIVIHIFVDTKMEKENYVVCDGVSYLRFHYKRYVYTKNNDICSELVRQKEIERRR
jgi:magnesium-transporting ATPase (P-type)